MNNDHERNEKRTHYHTNNPIFLVLYEYCFIVWNSVLRYLDLRVATFAVYLFSLSLVYYMYYYILALFNFE